jgi:xanthine dehydrogenase small subunit
MPNAVEPPSASPASLEAAYALLADPAGPPWRPLAGGTDLMVQIAGEIGEAPERIIDLWRLDELRGITVEDDMLVLGALTTYTDIRRSDTVRRHLPALAEAAATIGAAQIQNRGTIGGNVVNASPAGDTLPVLLAVDAEMVLGSHAGERTVAAADFWPSYRTTLRRDDELLLRVRIPLRADRQVRFRKVGTRRAQAISKVAVALAWRATDDGATWSEVRVALGSVAATPIRARATEAALAGRRPDRETADAAAAALTAEIQPIDDVRSTADYRRAVAGRVLHRLIRDAGGW